LETKKALEASGADEITVLVDSPESRENVKRFAESQGCSASISGRTASTR
jgi:TusA-related sulfurtransferase